MPQLIDQGSYHSSLCSAFRLLILARKYMPDTHVRDAADAAEVALEQLLIAAEVPLKPEYHRRQAEQLYSLAVSSRVRRVLATEQRAIDAALDGK